MTDATVGVQQSGVSQQVDYTRQQQSGVVQQQQAARPQLGVVQQQQADGQQDAQHVAGVNMQGGAVGGAMGSSVTYPPVALVNGVPTRSVFYGPVPSGVGQQHVQQHVVPQGQNFVQIPVQQQQQQQQQQLMQPQVIQVAACVDRGRKRKCAVFDLEPHMPSDRVREPTLTDIISASMSLLSSMIARGVNVDRYASHIRFLVDKSHVYDQAALVEYDFAMRERADIHGSHSFCYADHDLFNKLVGLENLLPRSAGAGGSSSQQGGGARQGGSGGGRRRRRNNTGYCFDYNRDCGCSYGTACRWQHVCSVCRGAHPKQKCAKGRQDNPKSD